MASYSRATMPAEFYDKTSDQLLIAPEPQYLYAQMFLGAMGLSLQVPSSLGLELPGRQVSGNGAPYGSLERNQLMLANPMFSDVFAVKMDFNGAPGNTLRINRPSFANTTYTQASRIIPSGSTISVVPITVASEQNALTLFRFGGPYDQANSRIAPYAIEAFDANMGVHNASAIHGVHLKRDFHRFIDAVNVLLLDQGSTTVFPEGMTSGADASAVGSFPLTMETLSRAEEAMDTANLPTFPDGFRAFVGTGTQLRQLKDDPQYARYAESFPQFNALFPQYVKSIGKFHIFKSNTLTVATDGGAVAVHNGHAIAPGALMGGMGRPPRVKASTDDNYGETIKVIWVGDLGFGIADNRFVVRVRTSA